MRKQHKARKQSPGSNSGTKGKCKTGEPRPLSLQSFFFPPYAWRWRQEYRCCVISERRDCSGKKPRLIYNLMNLLPSHAHSRIAGFSNYN